ncbi:hypothetical protein ACGFZL_08625 [Streptomyces sp. NPDC048182]|uniref:hypothetical protein n=1 Tax=Streptomyces sp. NPDC048182 TaxID=3365507 RepID=UPI00371A4E07
MTRRRPTTLTALALTAVAALSLTACGGGDSSSDKDQATDKIAGADTSEAPSASSSPSPKPTADAGRPEIQLPADLKLIFEETKTGDPVKDAILSDSAERLRAVDAAITGTDRESKALHFYNADKALEAALSWVARFKDADASMTGEVHYYDRKVTRNGETAVVTFCGDESKGFGKDRKTGKVAKTPVTKDSYLLYNTKLVRNDAGVWRTTQIISTRGAAQCQP